MAMYLVFDGNLKDGISKVETVDTLAKLGDMTPNEAERRFFRGKPVRVKACTSLKQAEALQARFFKLGVIVDIKDSSQSAAKKTNHPADHESQIKAETPKPVAPTVEKSLPSKRKRPKPGTSKPLKILTWATLSCAALLGTAFLALHFLFKISTPERVIQIENALFQQDLAFISLVDVAKLNQLNSLAGGGELSNLPMVDDELLLAFTRQGIDLSRDITHFVFALGLDDTQSVQPYLVLTGNFDTNSVLQAFQSHYDTDQNALNELEFRKQDRLSCEYSTTRALFVSQNLMVIAAPGQANAINEAIQKSPTSPTAPASWLGYRQKRMVSAAVFMPEKAMAMLPGMLGMLVGNTFGDQGTVNSVYLGIQGQTFPPGLYADIAVQSKQVDWLSKAYDGLSGTLTQAQNDPDSPELLREIAKHIELERSESSLTSRFYISKTAIDDVKQKLTDGLGAMFKIGSSGFADSAPVDSIDEDRSPYLTHFSPQEIPVLSEQEAQKYIWHKNNLGVDIKALRVNEENVLELEIEARLHGLKNLSNNDFASNGELIVLGVLDSEGNNLMREETCGADINSDPARLKPSFFGQVGATKTVQLKPNIDATAIANVKLALVSRVHTQTDRVILPTPLDQHDASFEDLNLIINRVETGAINISYGGNLNKLANIQALNKDKKYLSSGGSFGSLSKSNAKNKTKSLMFQGDIKYVEITYITQNHEQRYDIVIDGSVPKRTKSNFSLPVKPPAVLSQQSWDRFIEDGGKLPKFVKKNNWGDEPKAMTQVGPVELLWFKPDAFRMMNEVKLSANCKMYSQFSAELTQNSYAVKLNINSITLDSGETISTDFKTISGFKRKSVKTSSEPNKEDSIDLMASDCDIAGYVEATENMSNRPVLNQLSGITSFSFPKAVTQHETPMPSVGQTVNLGFLTLMLVENNANRLIFSLSGDIDKLTGFHLVNTAGEKIGFDLELDERDNFDKFVNLPGMIGRYSLHDGIPEKIIVFKATERFQKSAAFQVDFPED